MINCNNLAVKILLTVLFLIYFSSAVGLMNSTDAPQFAQIEALVEKRSLKLNFFQKYLWPDIIEENGNLYTKRDPGFAYFNLPLYLFSRTSEVYIRGISIPNRILEERELKLALITYSLSVIWVIIMLYIFIKILEKLNIKLWLNLLITITLGLGTLFWRQSYSFTRQPLVSLLLLFILWLLLENPKKKTLLIIYGLIMGLILFIDLTAVILFIPFGVFLEFQLWKNINRKKQKILMCLKWNSLLLLFFLIGSSPLYIYNYLNFGKIIKPPYLNDQYLTDFNNLSNSFAANPLKVAPLLLFSWNDYPNPGVVEYFNTMPDLANKIGVQWFLKRKFEGIFYISPILFMSLISIYSCFKKKNALLITVWGIVLLWLLFISKYSGFFAANAFNTYYLLPIIPLLFLLSAFGIKELLYVFRKNKSLSLIILTIVILLVIVSIYRGWTNNLTNYAPHITGDFRVDPALIDCKFCKNRFIYLFNGSFPNLLNLRLGIVFWLILLFFCEIIDLMFHKDKRKKP